ncbi:putative glycosyltransferase family 2 protein [Lyophyllum shimeji]|uniref:Glycosyltransferase family 2 protein n=1 Tax=Lyophyllum shimeji TaxID=47721 RepID=A0A9P3PTP3_LYOSH|nr:putative glycosyltransferase family 2 protein [Lyophyllum shimeji]
MDYDRNDALLHWLFRQTQGDAWFRPNEHTISSGVALRISDVNEPTPEFRVFPYENPTLEPFETAVAALNPAVAIKIRSAAVHAALASVHPDDTSIYVDANTRIQIIDTMLLLPTADKEQGAAFIRDERVLIIWSDALDRIIPTCTDFEERLIKLLWRAQPNSSGPLSPSQSISHSPALSFSPSHSLSHSAAHGSFTSRRSSVDGSVEALTGRPASLSKPSAAVPPPPPPPKSLRTPSVSTSAPLPPPAEEKGKAPQTPRVAHTRTRTRVKRTWYGKKIGVVHTSVPRELDLEGGDALDTSDEGDSGEKGQPLYDDDEADAFDPRRDARKTAMWAPFYNGLAAGLALLFIGNGIKILLQEYTLDGSLTRFALLALCPLLYCVSLFFTLQIIQNVSMVLGPIEQYHANSKYYSGIKPRARRAVDDALPHITIQMPVYKEGLANVLAPSIYSLKRAMQTYARQGGTSNIFVNDDGLRLLPAPDRAERLAFYAMHGIGWVARPAHGDRGVDVGVEQSGDENEKAEGREKGKKGTRGEKEWEGAYVRAGRFKKASNMNYALALSLKVERHLARLIAQQQQQQQQRDNRGREKGSSQGHGVRTSTGTTAESSSASDPSQLHTPTQAPTPTPNPALLGAPDTTNPANANVSLSLEDQALALAVEEAWWESGRRHRPWAANGRATRMGEIVLLVDSDTVVPEDCLRDAAREMRECPSVAIIQHESDVMQVAHHYFENGIAYFTRRINRCISMACANGEVAPFVGHNAFLRWSALQDVAFFDPRDGKEKIWSETNVSEDFDLALRLMGKGYIVRWATYSKGGFKEGVSLSVDDELNRWQKYAYGCSELLFNPFVQWFRHGPFAHQIHRFLWSGAPLHYKFSMMAYMFSYYGIAAAVTISIINYVLLGFQFGVDGFYMHSFEIWLATTIVFFGSGTVGFSSLQYRLGHKQLIPAFLENLLWIPFFFFFFGGLSIPVSQAMLAHLFSYNISWSATIKEVQRSNFFKEIPKIAKRFWFPMSLSFVLILGMIVCSTGLVPIEWRVDGAGGWAVIFPVSLLAGCHILFPIVLNPWLMVFSY